MYLEFGDLSEASRHVILSKASRHVILREASRHVILSVAKNLALDGWRRETKARSLRCAQGRLFAGAQDDRLPTGNYF